MTDDKAKAITCVALSVVGWLFFLSGILFWWYAPHENEFSPLVNFGNTMLFVIVATVIHFANCILGIIFLLPRTEYKAACIAGFSVSVAFIICCVIFCFFAFWTSSSS